MSVHHGGRGPGHVSRWSKATTSTPTPTPPTSIVLVGDSWIFNGAYYVDAWEATQPTLTKNVVAGNGWKCAEVLTNIATIAAFDPEVVMVAIAFNDLGTRTAADVLTDLQQIATDIRAACPSLQKIGFATVPASTTANINTRRATLNPNIRAGVGVWHDFVVPYGENISDADASDTSLYDNTTPPGHPKAPLGTLLTATLGAAIDPIFAGTMSTSPSAFTFADLTSATASTSYEAYADVYLTGMTGGYAATAVHSDSGTFKVGRAGTTDTSSKTVFNGDRLAVVSTSGPNDSDVVLNTVTVGSTADTWSVTTVAVPLALAGGAAVYLATASNTVKTTTSLTAPGDGRPIIALRQANTNSAPTSVTVQVNGTGPNHACTMGPNNGTGHTIWLAPDAASGGVAGDTWIFTATYPVAVTTVFHHHAAVANMSASGGWGATFLTASSNISGIQTQTGGPLTIGGGGNIGVSWSNIRALLTQPGSLNGQTLVQETIDTFTAGYRTMWCTSASSWTAAFSHGSIGTEWIHSFELVK